jgi:hypothetical protein
MENAGLSPCCKKSATGPSWEPEEPGGSSYLIPSNLQWPLTHISAIIMPLNDVIQSYSLFSFQFHRCSVFNCSLPSFRPICYCIVVITENFIFVSIRVISQFYNAVRWFAKRAFTFLNYICTFFMIF